VSKYSISCVLGNDDTGNYAENYAENYTESYADQKNAHKLLLYNLWALSIL
jgi:hypothetical protein